MQLMLNADFASAQEVDHLRQEAERLLKEFDPKTISIFSTREQTVRVIKPSLHM
jgi:hypothetical protein